MTIIDKTGDIFTSNAGYIGHGVNVYGIMGAGIAVQVRNRFPEVYRQYGEACASGALVPGDCFSVEDPSTGVVIANLASQDKPGANARIDWVKSSLNTLLDDIAESDPNAMLALPRIASNIGGLDWVDVRAAIVDIAEQYPDITLELWTYDRG